ncbi:MAG: ATP-binding cassette domain-containing protein [Treponema sp.]|nr:ATP-binding cassette domain-containing protein [Candidatus Treponema equi]
MIEVSHVSRLFGEFRAVDDISFSIQTGEIVGLLGPNGAGKTTTMRMITGYLDSSDGTILVDGQDVKANPVAVKSKIGYMPESAPMYSDMIVADYLEYVAKMEGQDPKTKIPHLAEICGLKEVMDKNIGELSRGNKQRVGLAHALMNDPEILILDEPTSGLDPNQVSDVRALIKKIGETRTVIISTHILSEVEMLCNRVIIISGGKKVADSSTEELRSHYGNTADVIVLTDGTPDAVKEKFASVGGASNVKVSQREGKTEAVVSVEGNREIRPELAKICVANDWPLYEMQIRKNSLEDVFKILTEAK